MGKWIKKGPLKNIQIYSEVGIGSRFGFLIYITED